MSSVNVPDVAIEVSSVSKVYSLAFRRVAVQVARYLGVASGKHMGLHGDSRQAGKVQALRDVSFVVPKGQVVGIIGVNGSGKSTLLRILAGITRATTGNVHVNGKVISILSIGTGLVPDLSGSECVAYMGSLYGMTRAEIERKKEDILAFADIGSFVGSPVRTYSSGMKARLAFSIVTSVDPEILVIDEALSVGDAGFVQKCRQRMYELRSKGSTVIIVSHSMDSIREMCQRVIWLHQGQIQMDGDPQEVIGAYRVMRRDWTRKELEGKFGRRTATKHYTEDLSLDGITCVDENGVDKLVFTVEEPFTLEVACVCVKGFSSVLVGLEITRNDGLLVLASTSPSLDLPPGRSVVMLGFGELRLGRFPYEARFVLKGKEGQQLAESSIVFAVEDDRHAYNPVYYQPVTWQGLSSSTHVDATHEEGVV